MARKVPITWSGNERKYWKKIHKGREYYLGKARCKSDTKAYQAALKRWKSIKTKIDAQEYSALIPEAQQAPIVVSKRNLVDSAVRRFLHEKTQEYRLGRLSASRVEVCRCNLKHFVEFIDGKTPVRAITESRISEYREEGLTDALGNKKSHATIKSRFQVLAQFVKWCWKKRLLEDLPRNLDDLTINRPPQRVRTYTVAEVQSLYEAASDRTKLYIALALNCGYTQSDISDLRSAEVDLKNHRIIRQRSKTGIASSHLLWSITAQLLHDHAAPHNKHDRMLLTEHDLPLKREQIVRDKLVKTDAISNAFFRLRRKLDIAADGRTFKHLRKTAATMIERIEPGLETLFLAHSPKTLAARHYILLSPERLDKALKELERQLSLGANLMPFLEDAA